MAMLSKDRLKKIKELGDLKYLNIELEKDLDQLNENVFYGQQLFHMGSWTYDIQKNEFFWTEGIYNILERNPQEFNGEPVTFYSYVHPNDRKEVKKLFQEALAGKEYDIEYRIVTPSGTEKYIHEKVKIILDAKKNPIKIIGTLQDIIEQKFIENNLKAFGDNLNQAQKIAGVGSWKYNAIKDEITWSDGVYRIYGVDPINFKKDFKSLLDLIHPEDQIKMQKAVEQCLAGKGYQIEYRIPQQDGTEKYVITKGEPFFDDSQRVVRILGTVQDVTESYLLKEQLRKSYQNLTKAQRLANIGSWEMDIALHKSYWSEEAYRIFGINREQYDGTYEGFLRYVHPEDIATIQSILDAPPKSHFDMEFRIIRPDGSVRNVCQLMEFTFDQDGKPIFLHGTIQDITEQKELQKKIQLQQQTINNIQRRYQVLVQDSEDVFEIISPDGTILYISPAVDKVLGYTPEELIHRNVFEFVDEKEKVKLTKKLELVLKNPKQKVHVDTKTKTKAGKETFLDVSISNQISEPSIQGIVLNWRDITARVKMQREMEYIATHDELTGLPNSVYFKKQLEVKCQYAKVKQTSLALMMLDIDNFKYINDALGYRLGDQLIIQMTQRLKTFLGETKFICRYSGDQFAIIVQDFDTLEEYESIAKDLINLFINPIKVDIYELDVTMSMGVSIYPWDTEDTESLKKYANIALLRAKNEGKNRYQFYFTDIGIQDYKQFVLRNDLRKAIEKNQFKVYYQPLVKLQTGDILAAEALIRWEHPDWGMVSPNEFISLAEETGFIINLGNWMLKEVCCNYKKWLKNGMPAIKVSINYSSIQFFEQDFVENIKITLNEFQLDPHFLIMEITESVLMKNAEKAIADIKSLQALGIQVALDDFGTGFSSLSYLNMLKIDILKIDRSFIKNVLQDDISAIITQFVINLARELKIKLVAEGIETWEQLSFLRRFNCYTGQGYLYSKPVPVKEFEEILANAKCKPVGIDETKVVVLEERRKYFRIEFPRLLEAVMTILEINCKEINVGDTKVVIRNIGAGGACFVSNLKLPIKRDVILQFTTQLLGKEIKICGCPVWTKEIDEDLYEYGIEFVFDENERIDLIKVLNQIQVKMRSSVEFNEGSFVSGSVIEYFNLNKTVIWM